MWVFMGGPAAKHGWHFLVGDDPEIRALPQAVGFHYNYNPETKQFAHATGIIVLTPQGKVSRYFYGIQYPPRDIRLALVEASNEKIGSPVDAVLLYCCQYDPHTGKYGIVVARVLKIGGAITLLCIGTLIICRFRAAGGGLILNYGLSFGVVRLRWSVALPEEMRAGLAFRAKSEIQNRKGD